MVQSIINGKLNIMNQNFYQKLLLITLKCLIMQSVISKYCQIKAQQQE